MLLNANHSKTWTPRRGWFICFFILLCVSCNNLLPGQSQDLTLAQEMMVNKNFVQAQRLYDKIINEYPSNMEARLNRAILLSWQQQYKLAAIEFDQLLEKYGGEIPIITAYGYNLAWSGNYVKAESMFRKALVKDPYNHEALKGLAYVALWKGKGKLAVNRFQRLLRDSLATPDLHVGLGHAHLLAGRQKDARRSFDTALDMDNAHKGGHDLLQAVQASPAFLEFNLWGGYTQFENARIWGLRAAEIAVQPNNFYRAWLRYDNTLSLENFTLVQQRQQSQAYFMGGLLNWSKYLATKVEVGYRDLPQASNEKMLLVEQLVFLRNKLILKGGGFISNPHLEPTWTTFAGVSIPVREGLSVEPLYFYSKPSHLNIREQRLLLSGYGRLGGGHQLNLSALYGYISGTEVVDNHLYGGSLAWMIPTAQRHWINVMIRYETGLQELFSASLGFKYRLER